MVRFLAGSVFLVTSALAVGMLGGLEWPRAALLAAEAAIIVGAALIMGLHHPRRRGRRTVR